VDPRAGMDDVKKIKLLTLPLLELRPRGHPARRQSLYRLTQFKYLIIGGADCFLVWVEGTVTSE
jgi:hypothetical protein